jgi:predicted DNA-binding transcriptional regulator AlpA
MGKKLSDGLAYPPRAMRAEQAAAYLSMSKSMFLRLVADKVMPPATKIRDMTTWDRLDLDAAYEDLKDSNQPSENTVHRRLREMDEQRRQKRPE